MKKVLKVFLIILLCIAVIIGFIIYRNWNTVLGVIDGMKYTQEDVEKKQEENKKELQKFLDENESVTVRDLTEEENTALANGEISEKDAVKIITGSKTLEEIKSENENADPPADNPPEQVPQDAATNQTEPKPEVIESKPEPVTIEPPVKEPELEKTSDQIISELIATLYVQKSVYISKLDTLESTLGAEFEKVPSKEKDNEKARIIAKYMPVIADWEKTCDKVVYGILDQIEAELKKSGKDLSIIDKIDEAYQNEKRLKKAYYVNNYL